MGHKELFLTVITEVILHHFLEKTIFSPSQILQICLYKYHINDLPVAFNNCFKKRSDIHDHDYPTRQVNDLALSPNKNSFPDHAIRARVPHQWNSLPLKGSKTVRHFRNQFK